MNEPLERIRPFVYLAVIGVAFIAPHPMDVIQAAAGGVGLGAWLWRWGMRAQKQM